MKFLGFEATVFLDPGRKRTDPDTVVRLGAESSKLGPAVVELVRGKEDFTTGLFNLAVCREARGDLGEEDESGG